MATTTEPAELPSTCMTPKGSDQQPFRIVSPDECINSTNDSFDTNWEHFEVSSGPTSLSELSKQLRVLQGTNQSQSSTIERLERQLKIMSDLKGVSVADLKSALADACQSEAYSELLAQVSSLQAQLANVKGLSRAPVNNQVEFEQEASSNQIAALELRAGELEEIEEGLRKELKRLYQRVEEQTSKSTRLESKSSQYMSQIDSLQKSLDESLDREIGYQAREARSKVKLQQATSLQQESQLQLKLEQERAERLANLVAIKEKEKKQKIKEVRSMMNADMVQIQNQLSQQIERSAELENIYQMVTAEHETLCTDTSIVGKDFDDVQIKYLIAGITQLKKRVKDSEQKAADLEQTTTIQYAEIEALRKETKGSIRRAQESAELRATAMMAALSQLRSRVQESEQKSMNLVQTNQNLKDEIDASRCNATGKASSVEHMEATTESLKAELSQLRTSFEELEKKSAELEQINLVFRVKIDSLYKETAETIQSTQKSADDKTLAVIAEFTHLRKVFQKAVENSAQLEQVNQIPLGEIDDRIIETMEMDEIQKELEKINCTAMTAELNHMRVFFQESVKKCRDLEQANRMLQTEMESLRIETIAVIRIVRESEKVSVSAVKSELSQLRKKFQETEQKAAKMERMNGIRMTELTAPCIEIDETIRKTKESEKVKAKMKVEINRLKSNAHESEQKSAEMEQIMKTQKAEIDLWRLKSSHIERNHQTQEVEACWSHEMGVESERIQTTEKLNATSNLLKKAKEFEHDIEIDLKKYLEGDDLLEGSSVTQPTDMASRIRNKSLASSQLWDDGASLVIKPVGVHSVEDIVLPQNQQYYDLTASKEGALMLVLHTELELLQTTLREFEYRAEVGEELALQKLQAHVKTQETEVKFRKESIHCQFQDQADRIALLEEQLSTLRTVFGLYIV